MARKLKNTSASSFLRAAWGHAKAARIQDPHTGLSEGRTNATFFAFHNVLGFAIELCLKAFLAGRGWTVENAQRVKDATPIAIEIVTKIAGQIGFQVLPGDGWSSASSPGSTAADGWPRISKASSPPPKPSSTPPQPCSSSGAWHAIHEFRVGLLGARLGKKIIPSNISQF